MLRFFTNRELSRNLLIPLAKWKRWAREFLPPDPLGGLQSGVTRQYSVDQSLTVYIGGYLVSDLKTSIYEARQIMADLHACLNDIGAFANYRIRQERSLGQYETISVFSIFFRRVREPSSDESSFEYTIRGSISREAFTNEHRTVYREEYLATHISSSNHKTLSVYEPHVKVLPISALVDRFTKAMKLDRRFFPILDHYDPDT